MISSTQEKTIEKYVTKLVLDPIFSEAMAKSGDSDEDQAANMSARMIVTKILA